MGISMSTSFCVSLAVVVVLLVGYGIAGLFLGKGLTIKDQNSFTEESIKRYRKIMGACAVLIGITVGVYAGICYNHDGEFNNIILLVMAAIIGIVNTVSMSKVLQKR